MLRDICARCFQFSVKDRRRPPCDASATRSFVPASDVEDRAPVASHASIGTLADPLSDLSVEVPPAPLETEEVGPDAAPLLRSIYVQIGTPLGWRGRMAWSDAQWEDELSRQGVRGWVARVDGEIAGLVELEAEPNGDVGIVVFGLVPEFIGTGWTRCPRRPAAGAERRRCSTTRRVWRKYSCRVVRQFQCHGYRGCGGQRPSGFTNTDLGREIGRRRGWRLRLFGPRRRGMVLRAQSLALPTTFSLSFERSPYAGERSYAARGTARARLSACPRRASIVRSA